MAKETSTAKIGFEKQIWDAACVLRGNMDASEYKTVVLGLIFLKYISDRFEEKYQKLVEEGKAFDKSAGTMAQDVIALMPGIPADISRIDTRCTDIMIKAIPNLVLAEDQAAFDRIKEETLAELEAADIQTSIDWWSAQEKDIKEYLQTVE